MKKWGVRFGVLVLVFASLAALNVFNEELRLSPREKAPEIKLFDEQSVLLRENFISQNGKDAEIEGTLEVLIYDDFDNKRSETQYFVKDKKGERTKIYFDKEPNAISGDNIKLKGKKVKINSEEEIVASDYQLLDKTGEDGVLFSSEDNPNLGEQRTAIILVSFIGGSPTKTPNDVWDDVLNPDNPKSVNSFYKEASYNKVWLTGDVFGWYYINENIVECNPSIILDKAIEAADSDIFFPDYKRVIIIFPVSSNCGFNVGTVGIIPDFLETDDGNVSSSVSWIAESYGIYYLGILSSNVIAHELGHNFGAYHAGAVECGEKPYSNDFILDCVVYPNVDPFDVMSYTSVGLHMNSIYKELFGWFDSTNVVEVVSSGVYSLAPYEIPTSDIQVMKIPRAVCSDIIVSGDCSSDTSGWYYLEYRRSVGFDSGLPQDSRVNIDGLVLHINNGPSVSLLLDMSSHVSINPDQYDFYDSVLKENQEFVSPTNGISIETLSVSDDSATVQIKFPVCCKADANKDGNVNLVDMAFVKSKDGCSPISDYENCGRFDINGDGSVNLVDMALVRSLDGCNMGSCCFVSGGSCGTSCSDEYDFGRLDCSAGEICCSDDYEPPKTTLIYLSTATHQGNLKGTSQTARAGADAICANEKPANLPASCSNIHAFLSVDANDEIRDMPANYGYDSAKPIYWWHNTNGFNETNKIDNSWSAMLDGSILKTQYSGTGVSTSAHSGSLSYLGGVSGSQNCNGFTRTSSSVTRVGGASVTSPNWISYYSGGFDCGDSFSVRCAAECVV